LINIYLIQAVTIATTAVSLFPPYGEVYLIQYLCDKVHQWLAACWWYSPGTVKLVFNSYHKIFSYGPQWCVYYCYRKAFYWKTWPSLCTDLVFL